MNAGRDFLATYVGTDGRVTRSDQGGDTVSEGQAYALLIAVAEKDRSAFAKLWSWTRSNLRLPSGLFAYHWAAGKITDPQPAADADLLIGWALLLAAERFGDPAYRDAARAVGAAVAKQEIGYDDSGAPVLAAGPWALRPNGPTTIEPGYWAWPAAHDLGSLTGDKRLQGLVPAGAGQLDALTGGGNALPPDWARYGGGANEAVAAPDGTAPVQSGQDGLRTLVWAACEPSTTHLAAAWWSLVSGSAAAAPLSRNLDGSPRQPEVSATSAIAAAAAARAAGDTTASATLRDRARQIDRQYPTYYGAAWVALGDALLDGRLPCTT